MGSPGVAARRPVLLSPCCLLLFQVQGFLVFVSDQCIEMFDTTSGPISQQIISPMTPTGAVWRPGRPWGWCLCICSSPSSGRASLSLDGWSGLGDFRQLCLLPSPGPLTYASLSSVCKVSKLLCCQLRLEQQDGSLSGKKSCFLFTQPAGL